MHPRRGYRCRTRVSLDAYRRERDRALRDAQSALVTIVEQSLWKPIRGSEDRPSREARILLLAAADDGVPRGEIPALLGDDEPLDLLLSDLLATGYLETLPDSDRLRVHGAVFRHIIAELDPSSA